MSIAKLETGSEARRRVRLLSLDGGGIRGVSIITILKEIMRQVNQGRSRHENLQPWQVFDLIGGTSTGGIIAIMLGCLKMTLDECEEAYKTLAKEIFQPKRSKMNPLRFIEMYQASERFDSQAMAKMLKLIIQGRTGAYNMPLRPTESEQSPCKVFVTTVRADDQELCLLRSYSNPRQNDHDSSKWELWEALRATSAANTYFDAHIKEDVRYVDGALKSNNPIYSVMSEADDLWDMPETLMVSIGTGEKDPSPIGGNMVDLARTLTKTLLSASDTEKFFRRSHRRMAEQGLLYRFNVPNLGKVKLHDYKAISTVIHNTQRFLGDGLIEREIGRCANSIQHEPETVNAPIPTPSPSTAAQLTSREEGCLQVLHSMAGDYESQRISIDAPVPGTCEWFLAHHKFTAWTQAKSSSILWLTANPGCGKSVLSNFLVESLQKSHPEAIMCYFFFKNGDQTRTESHQAICALLHQLLMRLPEGVKSVLEAFSAKDHNLTSRNVEGLWKIFTAIVKEAKSPPVFFVIDALDECSEESRNRLIDLLSSKFSQPESDDRLPGPVRVLATSRPWPTIERRFKQSSTIRLRGEDETRISKDIEAMVNYKLQEFSEIESLSPETKDLIGQRLLSGADQTFLWVSLVFDQLAQLQSRTLKSVRKALENIPTQLDQLYETTFSQFQDKNASSRLLRLIVAAKEPLHLDEINILLNIDRDTESLNLLRQDLEPNMEYATKQLGGFFIRIINSRVHLVHQTAREFLLQGKTELHSNITTPHIDLDYGESEIAEACIRFLTLPDIPQRDSLPSKKDDLPRLNHQFVLQLPVWARLFYPYAAINWGVTKGAEAAAARDKGLEVDMHLLCDAEETIFPGWWCFYAMKNPSPWGPIFWCDNPNFAHLSIARGHFAISKMLIETGSCKTNSRDSQGRDVLFIATWERQWEHFEWLLSRFSFSEAQIGSALIAAALQPHMDILNSLIKTGVDLNASYDFKGGTETPGENAIWRTDILEPFLNNGLVVTDEQIMGTAKCGYSEPLKLLLVHDVRDNESKRAVLNQALREAAYWGYVDCYDIIMSFAPELIVQAPDISRGLEQAILRADSYNLTRLLSKGADASEALSIASQLGHAQTTEILLQARTYSGQQLNEALAVFFDVHTSPELGEYVFNRMQSVLTSTDSGVRLHNAFKVVPSFKQGMSYLGLYLERGAKITPEQYIKSTSQAIALDEEFANFLLDNISRLQNSALKQEDFLPLACLWGKTGVVEAIVNRSEGQMNNQEGLAIDPIFISTASGNPDVVRYILQKGADPRRVFECSIKRPLDPLASVYFQELIRLLGGCISESAISLARRLKYGDIEKLLETTQPP